MSPNVRAEIESKRLRNNQGTPEQPLSLPQKLAKVRSERDEWGRIAADPTLSPEAAYAARQAYRSSAAAMRWARRRWPRQQEQNQATSSCWRERWECLRSRHSSNLAASRIRTYRQRREHRPNNLNPENFGQALVESAERNGDFKAVRGDMTKGQMWDLATELGLNLEDVNLEDRLARIVGKFNDLAPVALALRRLTRSLPRTSGRSPPSQRSRNPTLTQPDSPRRSHAMT